MTPSSDRIDGFDNCWQLWLHGTRAVPVRAPGSQRCGLCMYTQALAGASTGAGNTAQSATQQVKPPMPLCPSTHPCLPGGPPLQPATCTRWVARCCTWRLGSRRLPSPRSACALRGRTASLLGRSWQVSAMCRPSLRWSAPRGTHDLEAALAEPHKPPSLLALPWARQSSWTACLSRWPRTASARRRPLTLPPARRRSAASARPSQRPPRPSRPSPCAGL